MFDFDFLKNCFYVTTTKFSDDICEGGENSIIFNLDIFNGINIIRRKSSKDNKCFRHRYEKYKDRGFDLHNCSIIEYTSAIHTKFYMFKRSLELCVYLCEMLLNTDEDSLNRNGYIKRSLEILNEIQCQQF